MITALEALAFGVSSRRNGFVLLLGSGLSSSAGILTGWEIVGDVIRRIAALRNSELPIDPWQWYKSNFGVDANYSALLLELAPSPVEREAMLRSYFEPTVEERDANIKTPTPAHHAIASLVAEGFIRNIVTTNFDRLMEQALESAGVSPVVLTSPDSVAGAPPLHHAEPLVLKVHGDYVDGRLKNTAAELTTYDARTNALLDELFTNFGVMICGWSAHWDSALRDALTRTSNYRFSTYWAHVGELSAFARDVIRQRNAIPLRITSANAFFVDVLNDVRSLAEIGASHPRSIASSVTSLKRFLVDPTARIRLDDLVAAATEEALSALMEIQPSKVDGETVELTLARNRAAVERLEALIIVAGYWGSPEQMRIFGRAIRRIEQTNRRMHGPIALLVLYSYPALLLFFSAALAAIFASRYDLVAILFENRRIRNLDSKDTFVDTFTPGYVLSRALDTLPAYKNRHTKATDFLRSTLREAFLDIEPDDGDYDDGFDWLEYLLALRGAHERNSSFTLGRFAWKRDVLEELEIRLALEGPSLCASGIFPSEESLNLARERVDEQVAREGWIQ